MPFQSTTRTNSHAIINSFREHHGSIALEADAEAFCVNPNVRALANDNVLVSMVETVCKPAVLSLDDDDGCTEVCLVLDVWPEADTSAVVLNFGLTGSLEEAIKVDGEEPAGACDDVDVHDSVSIIVTVTFHE